MVSRLAGAFMINVLLLLTLAVPNPAFTPGAIRPLTTAQVCSIKWGLDARHVTESMKMMVAFLYSLPWPLSFKAEWDHLIPREVAGADVAENIWPQPWNEARQIKDPEENRWHKDVCAGRVRLAAAQDHFRHWRGVS